MENIGNQIVRVREKFGISRTELARRIGITPQQLQTIEKTNSTKLSTIRKIQSVIDDLEKGNIDHSVKEKLQNTSKSESWYQSVIDELRADRQKLMAQIDKLTHLLELAMNDKLGKLLDATGGGFEHFEVTNSVASAA